jgi:hypothetical protein
MVLVKRLLYANSASKLVIVDREIFIPSLQKKYYFFMLIFGLLCVNRSGYIKEFNEKLFCVLGQFGNVEKGYSIYCTTVPFYKRS